MNVEPLIATAYKAFSYFERPKHVVDPTHCEECAEYEAMLSSTQQRDLSIAQIGTTCWGPIPSLTPEAMAYYMPRLIEFAISGIETVDSEPYFTRFINSVCEGPTHHQYSLFGAEQRKVVALALQNVKQKFYNEENGYGFESHLESAIDLWSA